MTTEKPDWIAVESHQTGLQVWLMGADDSVLQHRQSETSMSGDRFETRLRDLLSDVLPDSSVPIVVCGMRHPAVSPATDAYLSTPCAPPTIAQATPYQMRGFELSLLPGVKQAAPPDLMRGEEMQVAGLLTFDPNFDGILCLPGPQMKWVHISAGEIVSFRTFMTGELFDLLSRDTMLRSAMNAEGWDHAVFEQTLSETLVRPADLAAKIFSVYADIELNARSADVARGRLLAVLIGAELAAAKPYWLGQNVAIPADAPMAAAYATALEAQGVAVRHLNDVNLELSGLIAAYRGPSSTCP
ncbi:2-dehydro-3-deoxygalactonokinase [Aliiroseovarius sp. S2029]|uniref:2-dehydro-3-deoxygalactonokinase n=1 Tax=Aliiroseovarius sp. S2029 TaxID=2936988 RepID=UPI0024A70373|nr:2-dehydro-3-deoxygalactonokinase [Aliiroseovarius sp. S2029]